MLVVNILYHSSGEITEEEACCRGGQQLINPIEECTEDTDVAAEK